MANYKLKLDLAKLCNVQVIDVQGKKCVVLPVEDNGIFLSQRGAAYLDLNIRESREVKYGQTHYAKVSVSKKAFASLSQDVQNALKNVVGNMSPDEYNPNGGYTNSAPQPTSVPNTTQSVSADDLPW